MTNMTLQAVRQLIANDSYAITFQSVEQYRATLLRRFDSLTEGLTAAHRVPAMLPQDVAHTSPPVTLGEALYALDLVLNKMDIPGLSGQRAYASGVLKRATASETPALIVTGTLPGGSLQVVVDPALPADVVMLTGGA